MRDRQPSAARTAPRIFGWLLVGALTLGLTGCVYDDHLVFGATEKWVASDINIIPKTLGTIVISPFDAILAPWFMIGEQIARDDQYHPDHTYISYAGSRTIARSDMAWGYQMIASIFSIPIDTIYLLITGPIDMVWVLGFGDDGSAEVCED